MVPNKSFILSLAFFFSLIATTCSLWLIFKHHSNFSQPFIQSKIVGIIWMVPIYCANSYLGLIFMKSSLYLDMLRDCYEGINIKSVFLTFQLSIHCLLYYSLCIILIPGIDVGVYWRWRRRGLYDSRLSRNIITYVAVTSKGGRSIIREEIAEKV